jgi:hypothetical protein
MRNFFSLLATALLVFLVACNKKAQQPKDDPSRLDPEAILTKAPVWKVDEIRFLQNNILYYYKRDSLEDNNSDFGTESIKFNPDKTGLYMAKNITYMINWEFMDSTKSKIRYMISMPNPLTVFWENITYTENTIHYTEYYTRQGFNSLAIATRVNK